MPKMKSKRALLKRIKVTGSGKVKIFHSHVSHLSHNKTTKQKRHSTPEIPRFAENINGLTKSQHCE